MDTLWAGAVLFILAGIIVTILQVWYRWSYDKHPFRFIGFFLALLGLTAWGFPFIPTITTVFGVVILATFYITGILCLQHYWPPMQRLYGSDTVPEVYEGIVRPKLNGQLAKVTELLLQDIGAWLIVAGLMVWLKEIFLVSIVFTLIVLILHLPAPRLFGKVFGHYFLWLSTALAFLVPLLSDYGEMGFLVLYAVHLLAYLVMYVVFGWLGRYNQP